MASSMALGKRRSNSITATHSGLVRRPLSGVSAAAVSAIDVATVTDPDHEYDLILVADLVQDPVVANPEPVVLVAAGKLPGTLRPPALAKPDEGPADSRLDVRR